MTTTPPYARLDRWSSFDRLLADASFTDNPYATYDLLRLEAPVFWSEVWEAWILTRYEDVRNILRDHRRCSNAGRFPILLRRVPGSPEGPAARLGQQLSVGMLQSDPPVHARIRKLVSKAFTTAAIEAMRPRIHAIVDKRVDAMAASPRMDVVHDLAHPLPAIVIAEMLGVPDEDVEKFVHWSDDIVAFQGTLELAAVNRAAESAAEMGEYCRRLCDERRARPQDDLTSALVAAQEHGDRLSEPELVQTIRNLLVAGHETTRNLISSSVLTLLRHPQQLELLRGDPSLLGNAVEECLRFESPIQRGWRRVVADVELHGHVLRRDQLAFLMIGAANRDPDVFDDPNRFSIERTPGRHIAFGFGIHLCVGAPLARLEASIALERLLARFTALELASDRAEWIPGNLMRGLRRLEVRAA